MKSKLSSALIIFGVILLAASLALFLHNQQEQLQAGRASEAAIPKVVEAIQDRQKEQPATSPVPQQIRVMSVVEINGNGYIGFLSIPTLELELPIMTDWSYPQLQIAPCRYSGSTFSDDLVIMAHNYEKHFGKLSKLTLGDTVLFTDMDGETWEYEVVAKDILDPTAVEEMISDDYDLTLFTCTYGGQQRVTVRCDRI